MQPLIDLLICIFHFVLQVKRDMNFTSTLNSGSTITGTPSPTPNRIFPMKSGFCGENPDLTITGTTPLPTPTPIPPSDLGLNGVLPSIGQKAPAAAAQSRNNREFLSKLLSSSGQWAKILKHTVLLEYFNMKEYALSNFAFQSF